MCHLAIVSIPPQFSELIDIVSDLPRDNTSDFEAALYDSLRRACFFYRIREGAVFVGSVTKTICRHHHSKANVKCTTAISYPLWKMRFAMHSAFLGQTSQIPA